MAIVTRCSERERQHRKNQSATSHRDVSFVYFNTLSHLQAVLAEKGVVAYFKTFLERIKQIT
jgi:hypothetical protein